MESINLRDEQLSVSQRDIIEHTAKYVQEVLSKDCSGHDWWHTCRVWKNAIRIGLNEQVDMFIVQLAAILHDVADYKFHGGDSSVGPAMAREWLISQHVDEDVIEKVCEIITHVPFQGANVQASIMGTAEGRVVQDADRLDSIGALGIARVFAYAGAKGRLMYDPNIKPMKYSSFEMYKTNNSSAINHFYEKLLLVTDLLNTDTAKNIAFGRHDFMKAFLDRFLAEWNGEA